MAGLRTGFALGVYAVIWAVGLPLILLYLWRRGLADGLYWEHLAERFGRYATPMRAAVWVHAVSLGEMRSAVPLVRGLLDRGERVVCTHFTPAGRRERCVFSRTRSRTAVCRPFGGAV